MAKQRIAYLDLVKLFTIYLVILGHVIGMMVNGYSVGGRLSAFIYSFHMPLFMLLSGYFVSSRSLEMPFLVLLKIKAQQLLLPAVTCTTICCIYLFFFRDDVKYRDEIIGNSWFLKILFVYYVLFYLLKLIHVNGWFLLVASCTVLFLIPHGSTLQLNLLFPYFWGGYMLKKYHVIRERTIICKNLAFFLLAFVALYVIQLKYRIPTYIPVNYETLWTQWHLILFRYMIGFAGCMSVIMGIAYIYKNIEANLPYMDKLAKYGQMTLGIYVLQTILVINVFPDVVKVDIQDKFIFNVIVAPSVAMGFLLLCLWLISICSKNRVVDLLLFGGQYYNSDR